MTGLITAGVLLAFVVLVLWSMYRHGRNDERNDIEASALKEAQKVEERAKKKWYKLDHDLQSRRATARQLLADYLRTRKGGGPDEPVP
ncbi:MAG: hypothetical protein UY96_C0037G0006 [Parcubacteria group bacterium GW2011_GWB1_56_8]|nr:MAG: hypothetical protein UY96_C0037G0006 [Parcubacteria group bacterium GW2011_GWB1_56_8]